MGAGGCGGGPKVMHGGSARTYARSVFVAANSECIKALLSDPELDVYAIRMTDAVLPEEF
ncbi:hypothetical protein AS189_11555 [Arthrobacter alpinus]|uniref:Uncharacterized protein n=1 Tax=Arthrobacter alpinus TaxID=656366 RepID=A0A0S2LZS1_9MICC|nr:hypothetical protein AS189_11555 [Arthrobacter alpinus]